MAEYSIDTQFVRTIGADGTAMVQFGPRKVREEWTITSLTTRGTSNSDEYTPKLEIFRNGSELVSGSFSGNFDTAAGTIKLRQNNFLRAIISGAEPGAEWTLAVEGNGR